eukprot:s240_g19.t1
MTDLASTGFWFRGMPGRSGVAVSFRWAPEKIPPSHRRPVEDRIRIIMTSCHPVHLVEAVECFEDFAKETGGEVEGPETLEPKIFKMYLNKGPKGHKKSKYKWSIVEYNWRLDFYPPKEGGLESIMKLNLPNQVKIQIK